MAEHEDQVLPVLSPVTDYEKVKRVGEGTYGVVCKYTHATVFLTTFFRSSPVGNSTCILQTRLGTEIPENM